MSKRRVLIIYRSYFPSESHLGPATAIRNLVDNMGSEYEFHLITMNIEFSTGHRLFPECLHQQKQENLLIEYVPRGLKGLRVLLERLGEPFDVIDIQCAFDPLLAIPALTFCRFGGGKNAKIFHTPHGIFMDVIMSTRRLKKTLFCRFADLIGLYRNIIHLAGSPSEEADIRRNHLRAQTVQVVSQFVEPVSSRRIDRKKEPNGLRVAFVGRVTAQKNLIFAIEVLKKLKVPSTFDVFGSVSDREYYATCRALANDGAGCCAIAFKGNVDKASLFELLTDYDVLLHPTLGENFGHSIVEALSLGVPVLISDRAPWTDVASWGAGWSFALSEPLKFVEQLEAIHAMGQEWQALSDGALRYARNAFDGSATKERYRKAYG